MNSPELEARIKALENEVMRFKDIEEIKNLQKIYGFYVERHQEDNIMGLLSDSPDVSVDLGSGGAFIGKKSIARIYEFYHNPPPEFLHIMPQINDVVTVDDSGKTAKGRWYGIGFLALPVDGVNQAIFSAGVYENEYVKENGKWKFMKIQFNGIFSCPYEDGWVKTPHIFGKNLTSGPKPDKPTTVSKPYPYGDIPPYHFKHPITGK